LLLRDPPKDRTIKCTAPVSTQFCDGGYDCDCRGDEETVVCRVEEGRCGEAVAEDCEGACECLASKQREEKICEGSVE
jgi:hypothetical protein